MRARVPGWALLIVAWCGGCQQPAEWREVVISNVHGSEVFLISNEEELRPAAREQISRLREAIGEIEQTATWLGWIKTSADGTGVLITDLGDIDNRDDDDSWIWSPWTRAEPVYLPDTDVRTFMSRHHVFAYRHGVAVVIDVRDPDRPVPCPALFAIADDGTWCRTEGGAVFVGSLAVDDPIDGGRRLDVRAQWSASWVRGGRFLVLACEEGLQVFSPAGVAMGPVIPRYRLDNGGTKVSNRAGHDGLVVSKEVTSFLLGEDTHYAILRVAEDGTARLIAIGRGWYTPVPSPNADYVLVHRSIFNPWDWWKWTVIKPLPARGDHGRRPRPRGIPSGWLSLEVPGIAAGSTVAE